MGVEARSKALDLETENLELIADNGKLRAENERLRNLFKSLHWHLVENTVNKSVFLDIVKQALKTKG